MGLETNYSTNQLLCLFTLTHIFGVGLTSSEVLESAPIDAESKDTVGSKTPATSLRQLATPPKIGLVVAQKPTLVVELGYPSIYFLAVVSLQREVNRLCYCFTFSYLLIWVPRPVAEVGSWI